MMNILNLKSKDVLKSKKSKAVQQLKNILHGEPYNTYKCNDTAITCNTSGEGSALYFAMIAILYYPLKNVRTFEGSWNLWNNLYSKKPLKYPSNIPNVPNV